jgi:hypothetical protein
MTGAESSSGAGDIDRPEVELSVSIRTILLVAGAVAVAWALVSIADVLLVIFRLLSGQQTADRADRVVKVRGGKVRLPALA